MMALIQQWLPLMPSQINSSGEEQEEEEEQQTSRINTAINTLSQLTGQSPTIMDHLFNTRAALTVISLNVEDS